MIFVVSQWGWAGAKNGSGAMYRVLNECVLFVNVSLDGMSVFHRQFMAPDVLGRECTVTMNLQVGFLYLRYVADPKQLWSWFEDYLQDDEV